jgi:lipopolysaccharide/colanic/teichoic acid biosynthesis glycosyltransferase
MEAEERRRQAFVAVVSVLAAVVVLPVLLAVAIALIARMTIG